MKKKVHERIGPTLLVTAVGFAALAVAMPEWARVEIAGFGVVFAALVVAIDDDIRYALLRALDACLRRHDTTSKPAKAPASSRAAT